jgi:hypothetical protein
MTLLPQEEIDEILQEGTDKQTKVWVGKEGRDETQNDGRGTVGNKFIHDSFFRMIQI